MVSGTNFIQYGVGGIKLGCVQDIFQKRLLTSHWLQFVLLISRHCWNIHTKWFYINTPECLLLILQLTYKFMLSCSLQNCSSLGGWGGWGGLKFTTYRSTSDENHGFKSSFFNVHKSTSVLFPHFKFLVRKNS